VKKRELQIETNKGARGAGEVKMNNE
jgi:hypothetical protein